MSMISWTVLFISSAAFLPSSACGLPAAGPDFFVPPGQGMGSFFR
jgi:hypothetical protein